MKLNLSRRSRFAIGISMMAVALSALASQTCIIDNLPMNWTGKTVTEGGKLLYVLKCLQGHTALALSAN